MRSHFVPACCIISNKGERTLFHCVLLCVGHETRDKVSYLLLPHNNFFYLIFTKKVKYDLKPLLKEGINHLFRLMIYHVS